MQLAVETETRAPRPASPEKSRDGFTTSLTREHGYERLRVEGTIPEALRGTLVRNGPGLLELFDKPYSHLFEGDGALLAVRFDDEGALGAHRVIQSEALLEERRRGRPLYGSNAPSLRRAWNGLRMRIKNAANTSVMHWQGRLLALFEAGLPTEVSLEDLSTVGATDLDGMIEFAFSAHPHRVASRETTFNFGQRVFPRAMLDIYELPDRGPARQLTSVPLKRPVMLHDFIATDTHLVFFVSPARLSMFRAVFGIGDLASWFQWTPEDGTEVIAIPIDRPDEVVRFDAEPFWVWHFANAFDRGSEIVVDYVRYRDFASLAALAKPGVPVEQGRLCRVVLDLEKKTLGESVPHCDLPCEFPVVDPARAGAPIETIWIASDDGGANIAKVDIATGAVRRWALPEGHIPSEPILVPGPGDDEGSVLVLAYDPGRHESYVAVLDATRPETGPVARLWLGHHTPPTFHGTFIPA